MSGTEEEPGQASAGQRLNRPAAILQILVGFSSRPFYPFRPGEGPPVTCLTEFCCPDFLLARLYALSADFTPYRIVGRFRFGVHR
jgi:hypothetical protein